MSCSRNLSQRWKEIDRQREIYQNGDWLVTVHDAEIGQVLRKNKDHSRSNILCPEAGLLYNKFMDGLNLIDYRLWTEMVEKSIPQFITSNLCDVMANIYHLKGQQDEIVISTTNTKERNEQKLLPVQCCPMDRQFDTIS